VFSLAVRWLCGHIRLTRYRYGRLRCERAGPLLYAGAVQKDMPPDPVRPAGAERAQPGLLVLVLGLGATLYAMFGLPVQTTALSLGNSFYFGDIRHYSSPERIARLSMSRLAALWWNYVGLILITLLVVLVAVTAAVPSVRAQAARATAGLAVLVAALHTVALAQTSELSQLVITFRKTGNSFSAAGLGIWVTYAGLAVVAAGAAAVALADRSPAVQAVGPGA
jgi:hypothetical protein